MKYQDLKNYYILPGKMLSAYHYILRYPNRIFHAKVKSSPYDIFSGECVFVDHDSVL